MIKHFFLNNFKQNSKSTIQQLYFPTSFKKNMLFTENHFIGSTTHKKITLNIREKHFILIN